MWSSFIPWAASAGTIAAVCPGTSVILAAIVFLPVISSISSTTERPYSRRRGCISSVWVVKGSACAAMFPSRRAFSVMLRSFPPSSSASLISHEPVVQTNFFSPPQLTCSASSIAPGIKDSRYRLRIFSAKSVKPRSRCVLSTMITSFIPHIPPLFLFADRIPIIAQKQNAVNTRVSDCAPATLDTARPVMLIY